MSLCLLAGALWIWTQAAGPRSPAPLSPDATIQINIPATGYPTIPASAPAFSVPIHGVGPSKITGTATFKDVAGTAAVLLHFDGLPDDDENITPAELHHGTCAAPGTLAYPLTAPDAGESETDLSITLKEFNTQRSLAVILYRSLQDHTAIACGDIP